MILLLENAGSNEDLHQYSINVYDGNFHFCGPLIEFVGTVKGLLAQWIEQQISNLWVPGSNPGEITK